MQVAGDAALSNCFCIQDCTVAISYFACGDSCTALKGTSSRARVSVQCHMHSQCIWQGHILHFLKKLLMSAVTASVHCDMTTLAFTVWWGSLHVTVFLLCLLCCGSKPRALNWVCWPYSIAWEDALRGCLSLWLPPTVCRSSFCWCAFSLRQWTYIFIAYILHSTRGRG